MGRRSNLEIRREEALDHFGQAIVEDGLEGASTGNVARRMGIPTSLLMHYFPSKAAMVEAMVDRMVSGYEERYLPLLSQAMEPAGRLDFILRSLASLEWENTDRKRLFQSCYPLVLRDEKVKAKFQALFDRLRNFLMQEFHNAMEAGLIPAQEPGRLADLIVTVVEGKGIFHPMIPEKNRLLSQELTLYQLFIEITNRPMFQS